MRVSVSLVWIGVFILGLVVTAASAGAVAVTLRGSAESMARQNRIAMESGLTFATTDEDVESLIESGELVRVKANANVSLLPNMMYPYGRPELWLFINRLGKQYRAATGEKLVVTSLTRPSDRQPKNGSTLSVHPAGVAVDLRVSKRAKSRQWLESVLLNLERQGVLDATRESYPPHYHVALFPSSYRAHVERMEGEEAVDATLASLQPKPKPEPRTRKATDADVRAVPAVSAVAVASAPEESPRGASWAALAAVTLAVLPVVYYHRRRLKSRDEAGFEAVER